LFFPKNFQVLKGEVRLEKDGDSSTRWSWIETSGLVYSILAEYPSLTGIRYTVVISPLPVTLPHSHPLMGSYVGGFVLAPMYMCGGLSALTPARLSLSYHMCVY